MTDKPELTTEEKEAADDLSRLRPAVLYEVVRHEGEIELQRTTTALIWSGIAAGLSIGLSPIAKAFIRAYAGADPDVAALLEPFGYAAGFIIVVLARQQLFTENTITTVLPLMSEKKRSIFYLSMRVWGLVLAANFVGAFLFALFIVASGFLSPDVMAALKDISAHAVGKEARLMVAGGIVAGWLIAAMVWVMPAAEGSEFWIVLFFTYMIGLLDTSHIVAGSVEAFVLVLEGDLSIPSAVIGFGLPTLVGNIIGGTALFALISYAQVKSDEKPE